MNKRTAIQFTIATAFVVIIFELSTLLAQGAGLDFGFSTLQEAASLDTLGLALGAGISIALTGIGAALGMGSASSAAMGAISEKPELFGKSILYIVLIEAIAIYGFVISFFLINKIA